YELHTRIIHNLFPPSFHGMKKPPGGHAETYTKGNALITKTLGWRSLFHPGILQVSPVHQHFPHTAWQLQTPHPPQVTHLGDPLLHSAQRPKPALWGLLQWLVPPALADGQVPVPIVHQRVLLSPPP